MSDIENNQQQAQQQNGYQQVPPQQPNGYQQVPPQQPYGYQQAPQQPYGYQQVPPQQPYGYQQAPQQPYGYQQAPQQPYGYQPAPQQPVAPAAPAAIPASPAEKDAFFKSASSIFMLIFAIISSVNLVASLTGDVLTLNIGGFITLILDILMVVGLWVTFIKAKGQKLSTAGLKLIKIPYTINFVLSVIGSAVMLILYGITLQVITLLTSIVSFVFMIICFSSIKKTLVVALDINENKSVREKKAGSFAAIVWIIQAVIALLQTIVSYLTLTALIAALGEMGVPSDIVGMLAGSTGAITFIVAGVSFLTSISGAIVILDFNKRLKNSKQQ